MNGEHWLMLVQTIVLLCQVVLLAAMLCWLFRIRAAQKRSACVLQSIEFNECSAKPTMPISQDYLECNPLRGDPLAQEIDAVSAQVSNADERPVCAQVIMMRQAKLALEQMKRASSNADEESSKRALAEFEDNVLFVGRGKR